MGFEKSSNERDTTHSSPQQHAPSSQEELAKVQKNNPVLGYLEESPATPFHHNDNSMPGRGPADVEENVPQPALSRQTANARAQAPAGAYSGASGEEYQRLSRVENCAQHLEGVSSSEGNTNNGNVRLALEATLETRNSKWWQQRQFIVIGLVVVSLLIALSIAIPVSLLQRESSEDRATEVGTQNVAPKTIHDIDFRALIPNITNTTINAIIGDPFSQQFRAYDFISRDPDWSSYKDWRKQQRFAVACYFYAFLGSEIYPEQIKHECNWGNTKCNDVGKVISLNIFGQSFVATMSGTIPPEIAFLSHMERFEISTAAVDNMEKAFPLDFFQTACPKLKEFRLWNCDLGGAIPSSLGLLTRLTSLDLGHNDLTGSIPKEIGDLPNLTFLDIEDNGLEAPLPAGFCSDARVFPWDTLLTDWCEGSEQCCG